MFYSNLKKFYNSVVTILTAPSTVALKHKMNDSNGEKMK